MTHEALLLTRDTLSEAGRNIAKLLEFFGIPWHAEMTAQFLARDCTKGSKITQLFCSSEIFLELLTQFAPDGDRSQHWREQVHSVFVYGEDDPTHLQTLLRTLTGNDATTVNEPNGSGRDFLVAEDPELCGVTAGVRVAASSVNNAATVVRSGSSQSRTRELVSDEHGAIFLRLEYRGVPVFLSTSGQIIDLDRELTTGVFDIRDHVAAALPIVLYIKWAFADVCWEPAETNACVVIDDPLLTRRYGLLNFDELLPLMKQHNFSTSIAFIPWNWSRSEPEIARLFTENPDVYSLSIHGCDHIHAEFGVADRERLCSKAEKALERMAKHESKTGITFDRVMIFPQGVFSEAALSALKHTGFIAAADHGTLSADANPRTIAIRDFWNGAVTSYSGFPIFTRRHPWDGVENFAFDILLGKPPLIGIHHDYCGDHCGKLVGLVDRLNALNCCLTWRSLGEIVKRSYWRREPSPGVVEVQMYGTELQIENRSHEGKRFVINKRESEPSLIEEVGAASRRLGWRFSDDRIQFEIQLQPHESMAVHVRFHELSANGQSDETISYRLRTRLRRYASELRDNYVMTNKLILATRMRNVFAADLETRDPGTLSDNGNLSGTTLQDSNTRMRRGFMSRVTTDSFAEQVSNALSAFVHWLSEYGETSWDHQSFFAGPIGGRAKSFYYRNRSLGTVAVAPMIFCEAFLPSARRLFHHPTRFPIADAHYSMGFAFLYEATGDPAYLERTVHFLKELDASRCRDFKEYCWGYPFDWVWRGGVLKEQTPLITSTPYIYEAFLQVFEVDPREEWRRILESIVRHVCTDIKDFRTSETASSCSYSPFGGGGVINAAAYRAFLLTSAYRVFSNDDYWRIAERNLNFVLENQNQNGSWYYAVDGVRDFVDHYHTCFVMKALAKIHSLTGNEACLEALSKGVAYYLENLFDDDGLPKPFSKAPRLTVYKHELYDCAECINLCLLLRDRFPQLETTLETVLKGILKNWIKPDGSFRSRRLHLGWDNVPMHRWGQSQMFRSLAYYLAEANRLNSKPNGAPPFPYERQAGITVQNPSPLPPEL